MSVILVLTYYLAVQSVQGLLIVVSDESEPLPCDSRRTISGIVWSCLLTIFSCTWVAVHPNVPGPEETWFAITLRRVELMLLAIIAPEAVILWAMRQCILARKFAKKYGKEPHKWTMVYGFFAVMGGFILYDNERAVYTYTLKPKADRRRRRIPDDSDFYERHIELYLEGKKLFITEKEIKDKSKGDMLSKCVVMTQTVWFVLQCITRMVTHLLELVTLAFAILNLWTYALWWHKPLNVECPVTVVDTGPISERDIDGVGEAGAGVRLQDMPTQVIWDALERFTDSLFARGDDVTAREAKRVPTLYAGKLKPGETCIAGLATTILATIFGVIHCAAWSFQFPTHTEQMLWRTSSLAITCLPWPLLTITLSVGLYWTKCAWLTRLLRAIGYVGTFLYVIARVALLVQAFLSLRSLPPGAYETVQWINYIPHI